MPTINRINVQLLQLAETIDDLSRKIYFQSPEDQDRMSRIIERLALAQKTLIHTQIAIFVEATESDLDMPVLPLFCEEQRKGSGEPEPADEDEGWGAD